MFSRHIKFINVLIPCLSWKIGKIVSRKPDSSEVGAFRVHARYEFVVDHVFRMIDCTNDRGTCDRLDRRTGCTSNAYRDNIDKRTPSHSDRIDSLCHCLEVKQTLFYWALLVHKWCSTNFNTACDMLNYLSQL